MDNISPELVERMAQFFRNVAAQEVLALHYSPTDVHRLAKEIADQLPKPIDPDLIEARKIYANADCFWRTEDILGGEADGAPYLRDILKGIKRGRELAGGAA